MPASSPPQNTDREEQHHPANAALVPPGHALVDQILTQLRDSRPQGTATSRHLPPRPRPTGEVRFHPLTTGRQTAASSPPAPLEAVIHRRSQRAYSDLPLKAATLHRLLRAATDADAALRAPTETPLQALVVTSNVAQVPLAIHRYRHELACLQPVGPIHARSELSEFVLQREFADAAALILMTGDFAQELAARGAHGYRRLLTRAGASVQAMWLTATEQKLAGAGFAGVLPHVLRERAAIDGLTETALFAFAVGHPA